MKQYKARDIITLKMSHDEAIEVNKTKGTKKRISKRAMEAALNKMSELQTTPGGTACPYSSLWYSCVAEHVLLFQSDEAEARPRKRQHRH